MINHFLPIWCLGFFKIDEKTGEGGSSKSLKKFLEIISQNQYQKAL